MNTWGSQSINSRSGEWKAHYLVTTGYHNRDSEQIIVCILYRPSTPGEGQLRINTLVARCQNPAKQISFLEQCANSSTPESAKPLFGSVLSASISGPATMRAWFIPTCIVNRGSEKVLPSPATTKRSSLLLGACLVVVANRHY